jgi:hypothetical protein
MPANLLKRDGYNGRVCEVVELLLSELGMGEVAVRDGTGNRSKSMSKIN